MGSHKINSLIVTFIAIVLALALTPSVASFVEDARYSLVTHPIAFDDPIDPATSNDTAVTYTIRNVSTTYRAVMKDTAANASITLVSAVNFTCTAAKTFTFSALDAAKDYWGTIYYETYELTPDVVLALNPIVPILWVVSVLAIGVTAVVYQLRKS